MGGEKGPDRSGQENNLFTKSWWSTSCYTGEKKSTEENRTVVRGHRVVGGGDPSKGGSYPSRITVEPRHEVDFRGKGSFGRKEEKASEDRQGYEKGSVVQAIPSTRKKRALVAERKEGPVRQRRKCSISESGPEEKKREKWGKDQPEKTPPPNTPTRQRAQHMCIWIEVNCWVRRGVTSEKGEERERCPENSSHSTHP